MFSAQTPIVDAQGRPTRAMVHALQTILDSSNTGLKGRVTNLETTQSAMLLRLSSAEATISAQAVTLAAHAVRLTDLEADTVWVTPWP